MTFTITLPHWLPWLLAIPVAGLAILGCFALYALLTWRLY